MFSIIKCYKNLFLLSLRSEFSAEQVSVQENTTTEELPDQDTSRTFLERLDDYINND